MLRITITILFLICLMRPLATLAQQNKVTSEIMPKDEVSRVFNKAVRSQFNIKFTILRVYKYVDNSGTYYCVLTEKLDSIVKDDERKLDTIHLLIRAINLKEDSGKFKKVWEINDHCMRDPKVEGQDQTIWFWTRYVEFADCDGDGLIDPIIVYGTNTDSDMVTGRIKFIVYYKGKKVAIRHTDCDLDGGRITQVDKEYHALPQGLKDRVKAKMEAMNKARQAIFEKTSF